MRSPRVARRYAAALFGAALEAGLVPQVLDDLGRVRDVLQSNPDIERSLVTPRIPRGVKHHVIGRIFAESVSPLVLDFLHLCIDKRRPRIMDDVLEPYAALRDEHENLARAAITTAVQLTEEQRQRLIEALQSRTGKHVVAEFRVNPEILGGVLTVIGDTVVDGSLRHALGEMRERLHEAPVTIL